MFLLLEHLFTSKLCPPFQDLKAYTGTIAQVGRRSFLRSDILSSWLLYWPSLYPGQYCQPWTEYSPVHLDILLIGQKEKSWH